MKMIKTASICCLIACMLLAHPAILVHAQQDTITPEDLIYLVNTIRTANGLPALQVNPILMNTAQDTADVMAAQNLTWHIGNTGERIQAAGYGTGYKVWATENFAMSWGPYSLTDIQQEWADSTHMIPMTNAAYCDIGAGVGFAADGTVYYIVHAAYTSSGTCEDSETQVINPTKTPASSAATEIAALDTIEYVVVAGDSLWTVALDHDTTTDMLKQLNDLNADTIYIGQKLLVPAPPGESPTTTPTITHTPILSGQTSPTQTATTVPPTRTMESTLIPTETILPADIPTGAVDRMTPMADVQSSGSDWIWQVIAGIEFIGLIVIIAVFWQPWIPKTPTPDQDQKEKTWKEPE